MNRPSMSGHRTFLAPGFARPQSGFAARREKRPRLWRAVLVCGLAIVLPAPASAAAPDNRVFKVGPMSDPKEFSVETGEVRFVAEGPKKEQVARFDAPFAIRCDLAPRGVDFHDYDLLKIQVKADAHAFLVVSLENFPRPGELSHWYVLDTARLALPWRTIWIDLHKPEEVKPAGSYKGMAATNPAARGIQIRGNVADIRRSIQGPGRSISLRDVRLVKKSIDVDWDQTKAPYTWDKGKDLVYRFPLTVTNKTDKPVQTSMRLVPIEVKHAQGVLSQEKLKLSPKEAKTIEAKLTLPAAAAGKSAPLYCERFDAVASVDGLPDSDVTILRSSDPIPLSVTVPLPEDKLQFPLLPRVSTIPESVTGFTARFREHATKVAEEVSPDNLTLGLGEKLEPFDPNYGFSFGGNVQKEQPLAGIRYREGLTACAFLYDFTGEKPYLDKGTQLLLKAAELFPQRLDEWRKTPYAPISQGIFAWNLLRTGWATGSMRWPYAYERHGMFNDFDLLAHDMDKSAREKIIRDFLLPAAVQMRNHYFGLTNQQDVVNYPVMYAGLVCRNWPLVSHAYDSSHGLLNQIKHNFDDEGLAAEGNYHKPSIEPILYACELLLARGIDLYDQRLSTILHSPAAAAIGKSYNSPMLGYADTSRFSGKGIELPQAGDGQHLSTGMTILHWKGNDVGMNWGVQMNRSAPDRCALRVNQFGGGNYTHSSLGQSILIVDEGVQNPVPATVLGYDIQGPVQYVCATSDAHFPGSRITRTFACIGDCVLVLDRVRSESPRTVDWCLKGAGDKLSLKMQENAGGFTSKPRDTAHNINFGSTLVGNKHFIASTDDPWTDAGGRLMLAGEKGTEVLRFRVEAAFSSGKAGKDGIPVLMVRRKNTSQADFVACFAGKPKAAERVPVLTADGQAADALGARVRLADGKVILALVNYQPGVEVHLESLKTKELFATDFPE